MLRAAFQRSAVIWREIAIRLALLEIRLRLFDRGLGLLDCCFSLLDLLIQFRRVDLGQNLPSLHVIADVGQAALEISVGASQNRSFGHGLASCRAA